MFGAETVHHFVIELPLEFFSCVWSQARVSSEELPPLFPLVLEALQFFCARWPSLSTSPQGASSTVVFASSSGASDRVRAWRVPPARAKVPLFARTRLRVSGGALVMAWLSLAERRLLVAHRSCICVAWGAVRHLPSCLALLCGWSHTTASFFSD